MQPHPLFKIKYYANIYTIYYIMSSNSTTRRQARDSNSANIDNEILSAATNRMSAVQQTIDATAAHKHHRSRDNIDYNKDLELLLKDNAEECESLGILHRASYEKYNRLSNYINIPVIILSSAIGFATGIDIGYANMNIILGVGSIFVGIIKSIDTYFQLGKRSESHRLCSLQYQQIHKKIQIELALQREQRQTAKDMLSVIKTDIKNLQDISPLVDQDIIDNYNEKYGKYTTVKKPNFVNGLTEVSINDTDEHGRDVLHSRPRSAPGSAGESLSGSDDEGGSGGGGNENGGGGGGNGNGNDSGSASIPIPTLNNLIQIHAFKGSGVGKSNSRDGSEYAVPINVNSLDFRNAQSSGLSQHSHHSQHSHVSSLASTRQPASMVVDPLRMPPNITASLTTLTAPSLLNTFSNVQSQSPVIYQNQTPTLTPTLTPTPTPRIVNNRNYVDRVDAGILNENGNGNDNMIITVEPENDQQSGLNNYNPNHYDDENGAM